MSDDASPTHPRITSEQMHSDYVVRFDELKHQGIPLMFIDSILPGHQRMNYAVIGDTASENPEYQPAITVPHKFQIGMGFAAPGNGPAYHSHDYVEMFLIFSGKDPIWSPQVEKMALEHGFHADASGKMAKPDNYLAVRDALLQKLAALQPDIFQSRPQNDAGAR